MAQEEPSLCGVTSSSLECHLEQDQGNKAVLWPVLLPCAACPVKRPERSTGHVQCVLVCYVIVFISPAFGTPWLGVWDPTGSRPIPSRTAGQGRDLVTSWMSSCVHGVSAKPSSRRKHVLAPQSRRGCARSCAPGPPGEAMQMQPCVPSPISAHLPPPSPPAPGGERGLLISLLTPRGG